MPVEDLLRGDQALIGVGGRHPDVYDHRIGLLLVDLTEQLYGVTGLADHLVPGLHQAAGRCPPGSAWCPRPRLGARDLQPQARAVVDSRPPRALTRSDVRT